MFKISFLIIFFLFACSSKYIKQKTTSEIETFQVGEVKMQPHQMMPINYLLNHPEQKGLLIAHYLGTGKTFLSLAYASKLKDKEVFIVIPDFLRASWAYHMRAMALHNDQRYKILTYEEAANTLTKKQLENNILIIDEIHHLVSLVKSPHKEIRQKYSLLYENFSSSFKILALSGTPIFTELSDLAYIVNLVSGKELLPYNNREFLDNYTKVNKNRSFLRGHLTESHLLTFGLPFVLAAIPLAFIEPSVAVVTGLYFGGIGAGFLALPLINSSIPLNRFPLRSFDADKLKEITSKYVSYFDFRFNDQEEFFPKKNIYAKEVAYNEQQIEFFLEFADKSLKYEEIQRLIAEKEYNIKNSTSLESTAVQNEISQIPLSGREIGNFHFIDNQQKLIESPKFEQIYKLIKDKPEGIVVYSSYFENGIKLFYEFLQRKGLKDNIEILKKDISTQEQMQIIQRYNQGITKILLLHPTFTEGISLEMTRQLHILEPLGSQAKYEQVIGRVVRFKSHEKLELSKRKVDVYEWSSNLSGIKAFLRKNNNWALRFNELNSIASFGKGQVEIDPNYFLKSLSPDENTKEKRHLISNAMSTLRELFSQYSIEGNK